MLEALIIQLVAAAGREALSPATYRHPDERVVRARMTLALHPISRARFVRAIVDAERYAEASS